MADRICVCITHWGRWDHTIHETALEFIAEFGVAPNILVANSVTHRRIDMAADKANVRHPNGETPEEGEYAPLACFEGPGYSLDMAIDEELGDCWVAIVWDDEFPGEEETTENKVDGAMEIAM